MRFATHPSKRCIDSARMCKPGFAVYIALNLEMYIAEIFRPGTWLDLPDQEISFEVDGMLRSLEDRVAEAAIALTMFESVHLSRGDPSAEWERDAAIRREVDDLLRQEVGELYYCDFDRVRLESERRVLKRKAELGIVPRTYSHKIPFIHAHTFVYAVDSFGKFLDELCEYEALPSVLKEIRDDFNARLPIVRKIRNSALHIEDRSRRYASIGDKKKGKKMQVDGFLGLSNLEGNQLCYTIDDGSYQKVAVSPETLGVLVEVANNILGVLPWKGPGHVSPS